MDPPLLRRAGVIREPQPLRTLPAGEVEAVAARIAGGLAETLRGEQAARMGERLKRRERAHQAETARIERGSAAATRAASAAGAT